MSKMLAELIYESSKQTGYSFPLSKRGAQVIACYLIQRGLVDIEQTKAESLELRITRVEQILDTMCNAKKDSK